jgi:hypothetical protein
MNSTLGGNGKRTQTQTQTQTPILQAGFELEIIGAEETNARTTANMYM